MKSNLSKQFKGKKMKIVVIVKDEEDKLCNSSELEIF